VRGEDGSFQGISGEPDYVRVACESSLRRLGVDVIDLYYQHRVDRTVPIEDTVGAMGSSRGGQGAATSGCRKPRRRRCGARTPFIPSARCRPSTRSGAVAEEDILPTCRALASASWATARSGVGS